MKTLYAPCSVESVRVITVHGENRMRDRQACKDAGRDTSVGVLAIGSSSLTAGDRFSHGN
jgi:hypothetical protein